MSFSTSNRRPSGSTLKSAEHRYLKLGILAFLAALLLYAGAIILRKTALGNIGGWSEMADAFATVFGLPVTLAGTYVAILLAVKSLDTSERQTTLSEKQTELSERLEALEARERALAIGNNTIEAYIGLANALDRLGRTAHLLDLRLAEALAGTRSDQAIEAAKTDAAKALEALSDAVSSAHKDPVVRSVWSVKSLREQDRSRRIPVLEYYANVEEIKKRLGQSPEDEDPAVDVEYLNEMQRQFLDYSLTYDNRKSPFAVSRIGCADTSEMLFGIGLSPAELARDLLDHSIELTRTPVEELLARRHLSEYAAAIQPFVAFGIDSRDRKFEAGEPGRFDFLIPQSARDADVMEPLTTRSGRAKLFNKCPGSQLHEFWPALANLTKPELLGVFLDDREPDLDEMLRPRNKLWPKKQTKRVRMSPAERAEANAAREAAVQRKFERACAELAKAREGVGGDPIALNRLGLIVVALLEKLPLDEELQTVLENTKTVPLNATEVEVLAGILKNADICGLMPTDLHVAMGAFESNAALLLSPLPPVDQENS